jgi:hypothetical protein
MKRSFTGDGTDDTATVFRLDGLQEAACFRDSPQRMPKNPLASPGPIATV